MKYNPYFREAPIPLDITPKGYTASYIKSPSQNKTESAITTPVTSDVEEIRSQSSPKGKIIFKTELDPGNLQPLLQKFWENGISVRVTSGKQNRKTSSGKTSWHTSGDAIDITPVAGETYEDLKNKLSQKPELLQWMRDNGYGILDETTPSMQQRTGASGAHWHIGKDRIALDNFKAWFGKRGGSLPKFQQGNIYTPNFRKNEETNFNGGISLPLGEAHLTPSLGYQKGQYNFEQIPVKIPEYMTNYVQLPETQEENNYRGSNEIREYIKLTEKFKPHVYRDSKGIETIGYGFTDPNIIEKYRRTGITIQEADEIFGKEIDSRLKDLRTYDWWLDLNPNQKDALLSLHYNIGETSFRNSPNLQNALQNKDWNMVIKEMNHGYNDEKNKGLRLRRDFERNWFMKTQ